MSITQIINHLQNNTYSSIIFKTNEFTQAEFIEKITNYKNQNLKFNTSDKNIDGVINTNFYIWS